LLHFNLRQSRLEGNPWFLTLFLRASPRVSAQACGALYGVLRQKLGPARLAILLRADAWFLDIFDYPLVPISTRPLEIPNSVRFMTTPAVGCSIVAGRGLRRSGTTFVP
jgi:hypothetical protein